MAIPTTADLERAKANLDAYDGVINGDTSDIVTSPAGQMIDSVARAIATLKAFTFRGNWAQNTLYTIKDVVVDADGPGGLSYVRTATGTSPASGTFQDEYDSGDGPWALYQGGGSGAALGSVALLRMTEGAYDGQVITMTGYYEVGDAPPRTVVWDAASTETDDGGVVFQVTGVVTGRWKDPAPDPIDIRHYGAKLDDSTDDYVAWNKALNRIIRSDPYQPLNKFAGTIIMPDVGRSYCGTTLQCKNVVSIIGGGSHIGVYSSNTIRFPQDTDGIIFHASNTYGTTTVTPGSDSSGSVVDGISFLGGTTNYTVPVGHTGHGVRLRGRVILRNVNVRGFGGDAFHITGTSGGGGDLEGSPNEWFMDHCRAHGNGGYGCLVRGADANAGMANMFSASFNGLRGIYDNSFLGNTWVQPLTEGNAAGGYKIDTGANTTLVNPYTEGGQPLDEFYANALCVGGILNPDNTKLGVLLSASQGNLLSNRGFRSSMSTDGLPSGTQVDVIFGGDPINGDILNMVHEIDAPLNWRLKFLSHDLVFDYGNVGIWQPYVIAGPNTTRAFGRSAPEPFAFSSDRFFTGTGAYGRLLTHYVGTPPFVNAAQGDVVFKPDSASGGSMGTMCTTAGINGSTAVYKAMPNLA